MSSIVKQTKLLTFEKWLYKNWVEYKNVQGERLGWVEYGPSESKMIWTKYQMEQKYKEYGNRIVLENDAFDKLIRIQLGFECSVYDKYKYFNMNIPVYHQRTIDDLIENNYSEQIVSDTINSAKNHFALTHDVPYKTVKAIRQPQCDIWRIKEPELLLHIINEIKNNDWFWDRFHKILNIARYRNKHTKVNIYGFHNRKVHINNNAEDIMFMDFMITNNIFVKTKETTPVNQSPLYLLTDLGIYIVQSLYGDMNIETYLYLKNNIEKLK